MSADWLPPERTLYWFAHVLRGGDPNGVTMQETYPAFRHALLELTAVAKPERAQFLDQVLRPLGLTDEETATFGTATLRMNLDAAKPATPKPLVTILSGAQLRRLPPMEYLVDRILPKQGVGMIYGPSGHGKTFAGIHLCGHVATGMHWYGRHAAHGPVLYVAAEGRSGIKKRYQAWCKAYFGDQDVAGWHFVTHPVYPTEEEMRAALYREMDALGLSKPAVVVLDTVARCFIGDENSTQDMGKFVRAVDDIKFRTDATVLLVHHTGWDLTRMRGSSALLAALDVEMRLDQDPLGTITLACTKMRDGELFAPWHFTLEKVPEYESAVLRLAQDNRPPEGGGMALPEPHLSMLTVLGQAGEKGMSFSEVKKEAGITRDPTLNEALGMLCRGGFVRSEGDPGQRGRRYFATTKGRQATVLRFGGTADGDVP